MAEKPKKTVIGSFFGRLHRSKSRDVSEEKRNNSKINGHNTSIASSTSSQENVINSVSSSKSDGNLKSGEEGISKDSPARRLMRRFSNLRASSRSRATSSDSTESLTTKPLKSRQPGGIMKSEQDLSNMSTTIATTPTSHKKNHVTFSSGAMSEIDLRFVTTRNDHAVLTGDDFGFGEKSPRGFLSETDLTSGNIEIEENVSRTPSYLRISCALNGYTRSPKKENNETSEAVRHMGESLVERRLKMFNQPQARSNEFSSPMASQITSESKSTHSQFEVSTPLQPKSTRLQAIQNLEMGNNVSTPQAIRDLISKFDGLDLCGGGVGKKGGSTGSDDENVEKIQPHRLIINETIQDFEKDPNGNSEKAKSSDFEDVEIESTTTTNGGDENIQPENFKIALDVESDSGISGSGNFSPESSKRDGAGEEEEQAESDNEFMKMHNTVKNELQKKMEEAQKDLENVDNLPEVCADSLRAANGNAHLLVRKKFGKFAELVGKHLKPIDGDPMPVNSDDLEAFWATIEMELTGIRKEFERVEKFRAAEWNVEQVVRQEEEDEQQKNVEEAKKKTPVIGAKKKPSNVTMSAEAKEKLEKQRQAAEARRAEMRSKMRQKMVEMQKTTATTTTNDDGIEC